MSHITLVWALACFIFELKFPTERAGYKVVITRVLGKLDRYLLTPQTSGFALGFEINKSHIYLRIVL